MGTIRTIISSVTNLSLTIQLDINMLTNFLKLLMAISVMVSLVRSAHFDLKNAKDVNVMSNECLKSGSCRGVLFHGSAPVPPPPSEEVSVSTTTTSTKTTTTTTTSNPITTTTTSTTTIAPSNTTTT